MVRFYQYFKASETWIQILPSIFCVPLYTLPIATYHILFLLFLKHDFGNRVSKKWFMNSLNHCSQCAWFLAYFVGPIHRKWFPFSFIGYSLSKYHLVDCQIFQWFSVKTAKQFLIMEDLSSLRCRNLLFKSITMEIYYASW